MRWVSQVRFQKTISSIGEDAKEQTTLQDPKSSIVILKFEQEHTIFQINNINPIMAPLNLAYNNLNLGKWGRNTQKRANEIVFPIRKP